MKLRDGELFGVQGGFPAVFGVFAILEWLKILDGFDGLCFDYETSGEARGAVDGFEEDVVVDFVDLDGVL